MDGGEEVRGGGGVKGGLRGVVTGGTMWVCMGVMEGGGV